MANAENGLDKNGLIYLWSKIKTLFNSGITDISISGKTVTITKGDGSKSTQTTQDTNTVYEHPTGSGYKHIPSGGSTGQILKWNSDGTATWGEDKDTTYEPFEGSNFSTGAAGKAGLVPAPTSDQAKHVMLGSGWSELNMSVLSSSTGAEIKIYDNQDSDNPIASTQISVVGTSAPGLMSVADKTKLNALPTNATLESTYAKKSDITSMYKYKGSLADSTKLPTTGQTVGDVYNIEAESSYGAAGMNVAWNGTAWDALGTGFTITAITNAEIDAICV